MMTPDQCRAARGLLDWTQDRLATEARVGIVTVRTFEAGMTTPRHATLDAMQRALERAGVVFIDGRSGGVRWHRDAARADIGTAASIAVAAAGS